MAVVDEFQDTDTVQWRILRRAFGNAPSRLVLVGDPKQAIYAFRGGDVHAYLEATKEARRRLRLPVSWRADPELLEAQDAFFGGAQLGAEQIRHRPVRARPDAPRRGLAGPAVGPALTVRIADRDTSGMALTAYGRAKKPAARHFIAEDLAADHRPVALGRDDDRRSAGRSPATSPCSPAATTKRSWRAARCGPSECRRSSTAGPTSCTPTRHGTGCSCCAPWSSRRRSPGCTPSPSDPSWDGTRPGWPPPPNPSGRTSTAPSTTGPSPFVPTPPPG